MGAVQGQVFAVDDGQGDHRAVGAPGLHFNRRDSGEVGRVGGLQAAVRERVLCGVVGVVQGRPGPATQADESAGQARVGAQRDAAVKRHRHGLDFAVKADAPHTAQTTVQVLQVERILSDAQPLDDSLARRYDDLCVGDVGVGQADANHLVAGRPFVRQKISIVTVNVESRHRIGHVRDSAPGCFGTLQGGQGAAYRLTSGWTPCETIPKAYVEAGV